ncbi:hypothetical protein BJY52DRAFT_1189762 [Lactarius psammicola]|nr:hypothetical protein BJY52DRAFT_1189762 [Lactarius psammicola]
MSTLSFYGSFSNTEFSQFADAQAMVSTTRRRPSLVGAIPTSTQSSFSSSHSDSPGRLTPSLNPLLDPLLGLSLSETHKEAVATTMQEQVIPGPSGTQVVETWLHSSTPEVMSPPSTSVADWWLPQTGLHQHPEAPPIPQSRPESVLSYTSDFSLSSGSLMSSTTEFPASPAMSLLSSTTESPPSPVASLQSAMRTFSPAASERF